MKEVKDHLSRIVTYPFPPKRIISLVPAITETLCYLGLRDAIVGRTRFCVFPDEVKKVQNVGGTKDIKLDRIHNLQPDLILAEKEENTKEIVESLEAHYPVFVFEIQTVADALKIIRDAGMLTERKLEATALTKDIQVQFKTLPQMNGKRIAY